MIKIDTLDNEIKTGMELLYSMKKLDFTIVELYFTFNDKFSESSIIKAKISKLKMNSLSRNIKNIGFPCVEISATTGKIIDFNK